MRRTPALLLGSWLVLCAGQARASDFWDDVRTPGRRQFQRVLAAAEASLAENKTQAALELADAALVRLPEQASGHALRGRALWALRRSEEAAQAFERALALDPAALDAAGGDGAAHVAALTGRLALAEQIAERLLARLPAGVRRAQLYALRGDVQSSLGPGRLRDAEASYRQAMRDAPELELRGGLGLALCLDRAAETGAAQSVLAGLQALDGVEAELGRWPLSHAERSARQALVLDHAGDHEGARRLWQTLADAPGPWRAHALGKLAPAVPTRRGRR